MLLSTSRGSYSASMYNKCLYPVDRVSALANKELLASII